jgi:iron transport multicopper oxidase
MIHYLLLLTLQVIGVAASTVTYNWNIDWATVAPDGFSRPAIAINGQWPNPPIEVNIGDRVLINLSNQLKNETTTIHFHGIFQTGSDQMDGPAQVTQCPINVGSSELQVSLSEIATNGFVQQRSPTASRYVLSRKDKSSQGPFHLSS